MSTLPLAVVALGVAAAIGGPTAARDPPGKAADVSFEERRLATIPEGGNATDIVFGPLGNSVAYQLWGKTEPGSRCIAFGDKLLPTFVDGGRFA